MVAGLESLLPREGLPFPQYKGRVHEQSTEGQQPGFWRRTGDVLSLAAAAGLLVWYWGFSDGWAAPTVRSALAASLGILFSGVRALIEALTTVRGALLLIAFLLLLILRRLNKIGGR